MHCASTGVIQIFQQKFLSLGFQPSLLFLELKLSYICEVKFHKIEVYQPKINYYENKALPDKATFLYLKNIMHGTHPLYSYLRTPCTNASRRYNDRMHHRYSQFGKPQLVG